MKGKLKNNMYAKEEVFQGEITGVGYDGEGVLRHDGKVVFVPYVLRGEEIKFKLTKSNSTFSRGKVVEVIKESPLRTKPPCPYYGRCGGCSYQHTSYQNELGIKKELLVGQLAKLGYKGEVKVVSSETEYGYRNKIRLFVGENGLSLMERGSNRFCDINACLLVDEKLNNAIKIVNNFIIKQSLQQYYSELVIREENENLLLNFILKKVPEHNIHYQGLYLLLGADCGIFETFKGQSDYKVGLTSLLSEEFGLKCSFSPNSFHQVNKFIGNELYKFVVDNVKGKSVINCYSGAGVLSGILAKKGKYVKGIELGINEHNDAEKLKEENDLFFLSNFQGDCARLLPSLSDGAECVIVDPPRAGMAKTVCEAIDNGFYKQLIYISCNSATLVRDLGLIKNYKLTSVTLFDMFARTGEYETVALLERKK